MCIKVNRCCMFSELILRSEKRGNNRFFIQPVNFQIFFSPKRIFIYFCACQSERKRVGQRKRILRFVPHQWTCTLTNEKRIWRMVAFTVMLAYLLLNINSGAIPLSVFSFHGSASPTGGNKDKFGRLHSVSQFVMSPNWADWGNRSCARHVFREN